MVILLRYSLSSKEIRIMVAAAARALTPAKGEVIKETTPLNAPKMPKTIRKPVRNREIRLSGIPVTAVALMRLIARITET